MLIDFVNGQTSVVFRVKIRNSSVATGAGLTGLTSASSGLIISTIADNEPTATAYTVAASNVQTITTLGTYQAPSASKCRFKEVDATNHPGLYEVHLADARFAVASAKSLCVTFSGATNLAECDVVIPLRSVNPYDGVAGGMSMVPTDVRRALGTAVTLDANSALNVSTKYVGGTLQTARDLGASVLLSPGTGAGQVDLTSGVPKANVTQLLGTAWLAPAVAGEPDVNVKHYATQVAATGNDNFPLVSIPTIATGVWNALTSGIAASGSIGKRLLEFITTLVYVAPTASGAGANSVTITIQDTDGNPLQSATVTAWLNGNLVGTTETGSDGITDPLLSLNSAEYQANVTCDGFNGTSVTLTVSGPTSPSPYQLRRLSITPSATDLATGWLIARVRGIATTDITHTVTMITPAGTGNSFEAEPQTSLSDADGLVQFTGLLPGALYRINRGNGQPIQFIAGTSTFQIKDCIG